MSKCDSCGAEAPLSACNCVTAQGHWQVAICDQCCARFIKPEGVLSCGFPPSRCEECGKPTPASQLTSDGHVYTCPVCRETRYIAECDVCRWVSMPVSQVAAEAAREQHVHSPIGHCLHIDVRIRALKVVAVARIHTESPEEYAARLLAEGKISEACAVTPCKPCSKPGCGCSCHGGPYGA